MKLEGKITQLIAIIIIAVALNLVGPWIINSLGEIFRALEGRNLNLEQLE